MRLRPPQSGPDTCLVRGMFGSSERGAPAFVRRRRVAIPRLPTRGRSSMREGRGGVELGERTLGLVDAPIRRGAGPRDTAHARR